MTEKPLEYVVGILIPGTKNPFLHMTICVIQAPRWGEQVLQDVKALAAAVLPLEVSFGDRDMFGPEKTLPVRLMKVLHPQKKELLDNFYRSYFTPLPGEEDRLTQTFHVSIKKVLGEADSLNEMALPVMFLKVVGVDEYIWSSIVG